MKNKIRSSKEQEKNKTVNDITQCSVACRSGIKCYKKEKKECSLFFVLKRNNFKKKNLHCGIIATYVRTYPSAFQ